MEGWVDLGALITPWSGIELMTAWSKVRDALAATPPRPRHPLTLVHAGIYTTEDKSRTNTTETKHNPEQEAKLSLG